MTRLAAVDAWFERAYARLGWRVFWIWVGFAYGLAVVLSVALSAAVAHFRQFSTTTTVLFFAALFAAVPVGMVILRPFLVRMAEPIRNADPVEAWRALLRLPSRVTRAFMVFAMCYVAPIGTTIITVATHGDRTLILIVLCLWLPVILSLVGILVLFAGELVMRPMLRDVAGRLPAIPDAPSAVSVRVKLLLCVPVLGLAMDYFGVMYGAQPGIESSTLLLRMLVTTALVVVVFVPIALVLAFSVPQPLGDLLIATARLREGDFTTRVPVITADEYGEVARSFNEAVQGLARGQALAEDNDRLLDEVRSSRARIVTASDAERRRVERNLHDGAQQRLVALRLELRMLEEEAGTVSAPLAARARAAGENLRAALDELRELGRGLHPSVLDTDGLRPALEQLACRAPIPVTIEAPEDRFDPAVESTAYFVAAEALANVAKYSRASRAGISVHRLNGHLVIEIADDGVGGAHAEGASGLAGLDDRVASLDGTLTVDSPVGAGTRVRAELPIEAP